MFDKCIVQVKSGQRWEPDSDYVFSTPNSLQVTVEICANLVYFPDKHQEFSRMGAAQVYILNLWVIP